MDAGRQRALTRSGGQAVALNPRISATRQRASTEAWLCDYPPVAMRGSCWFGVIAAALVPRLAQAQTKSGGEPPASEAGPPEAEAAGPGAKPAKESGTEAPPAKDEAPSYGHGRQFGVRGGLVGGYRMVFRYDKSPFCAKPDMTKKDVVKDQQKFCGHAAPLAAEVALSFAPLDSLEPFIFGRFGLAREKQTDTDPVLIVGLGLRVYTMSDSAFKIFIEPAIGSELEGGGNDPLWDLNKPDYKKDVIFHLAAGPQYDFAKYVGLYLDAGMTTGVLRSIHSNLELHGGLQFRAP